MSRYEYDEEYLNGMLKCENNNLKMLKNTLTQMLEMNSNHTEQVEMAVNASTHKIELIKQAIETKTIPDELFSMVTEANLDEFLAENLDSIDKTSEKFYVGGSRKLDRLMSCFVKSNDFIVYFDSAPIDGNFVKTFNDIREANTIIIELSSYINSEDKKNGNLEQVVEDLWHASIGTVRVQYPAIVDDESFSIKEYVNCKVLRYQTSPFDYKLNKPRTVTLEISYGNLRFVKNETTD